MFDPSAYIETLTGSLNTCIDGDYKFARISGMSNMEGILANRKRKKNFVAIDDSENGAIVRGGGAGYFDRRPYTVIICSAIDPMDMDARDVKLEEHRGIYRSFLTRMIRDRAAGDASLMFLDPERAPYFEIAGAFGNGCVGIYFMIYIDNPINLTYNDADWTES